MKNITKKYKYIIVGDSDKDIITGKNAGIDTCLYYPKENEKFYRKEFLEKDNPDYVVNDLTELMGIV